MSFYIIDPLYLTAETFTLEALKRKVNENFVVSQWNQGLIPIILKQHQTPHVVYHLVTLGKTLCESLFVECKGMYPTVDRISTFLNGKAKPYLDEFMEQRSYNKDDFVVMIVGEQTSRSDKRLCDVYLTMSKSVQLNISDSGVKPAVVDLSSDYIHHQYTKLFECNLLAGNPDGLGKHIRIVLADKLYSPESFNHPDVDNLHNLTFQMRGIDNNRAARYCPNGYLVWFSSDLTCGIFGEDNMFRFKQFEHYLTETCMALGLDPDPSMWEIRFLAYESDWIMPAGNTEL